MAESLCHTSLFTYDVSFVFFSDLEVIYYAVVSHSAAFYADLIRMGYKMLDNISYEFFHLGDVLSLSAS